MSPLPLYTLLNVLAVLHLHLWFSKILDMIYPPSFYFRRIIKLEVKNMMVVKGVQFDGVKKLCLLARYLNSPILIFMKYF